MCFYLAWITRISRLVYGATIRDSIDVGLPEIKISAEELNKKGNNRISIQRNFLRDECLELLKETHKRK
jgi:tRNA(Arg) A34 adenosine deaminase TadA